MKRLIIASLVALVGLFVIARLTLGSHSANRPNRGATAEDEAEATPNGEESGVSAPRRRSLPPPRAARARGDRSGAEAAPEMAPRPAAPRSDAEMASALNAAFDADRPGGPETGQTRTAIATAFRDARATGAMLRGVECRATRCRLDVEFTDKGADKRVLSQIFVLLSSNGVDTKGLGFTVPTREVRPDGSVVATIHLYRGEETL